MKCGFTVFGSCRELMWTFCIQVTDKTTDFCAKSNHDTDDQGYY